MEVSPRRFFRYSTGKEDVALAKADEFDALVADALANSPEDEPSLSRCDTRCSAWCAFPRPLTVCRAF